MREPTETSLLFSTSKTLVKSLISVLALVTLGLVAGPIAQRRDAVAPTRPLSIDLFQASKISTIDLEFSPADYSALAPHSNRGFGLFGFGGGGSQSWLQGSEGKRNGFAAGRGVEFSYVHAAATINGTTLKNIGVRYKGNGTYFDGSAQGKVSLKLDFAEFVKGQRFGRNNNVLATNSAEQATANSVTLATLNVPAGR